MASVTYDHVTKQFGNVTAVNDLNLEIKDKEFLVLVGPSGCGKSTALRLLAGLEEITSGNIYIGEHLVNDVPPKDRDIAMVFQSYALYPHMNVYDNMAFGLRLRKTAKPEIDRRVKEAAEILGISPLLDRKPRQLSGGQRQRVALGRAIVREPKVFLMDEPLSNLDAKLRVQTRAELSKLHQRLETTFIYVTHDQTEAMTMGTRIAVLKDGLLQQLDTPQNLYDHPLNIFVAGFIGSPAMNFFPARLLGEDSQVYLQADSFRLKVPAERAGKLVNYRGQEMIFGIRPEDIHDRALASSVSQDAVVKAQVEVTELMGSEVFLYLSTGKQNFTARVEPRTSARPGKPVELVFNMERMHLFDPNTEERID
ncbi:MAG: ABC transporter ATP-binding protein [Chloroflexi bacterium]|nr:ABC transporter ATP-binding protein [Chloroflexota bacterium]